MPASVAKRPFASQPAGQPDSRPAGGQPPASQQAKLTSMWVLLVNLVLSRINLVEEILSSTTRVARMVQPFLFSRMVTMVAPTLPDTLRFLATDHNAEFEERPGDVDTNDFEIITNETSPVEGEPEGRASSSPPTHACKCINDPNCQDKTGGLSRHKRNCPTGLWKKRLPGQRI